MGNERLLAGFFAGIGGVTSLVLGVIYNRAELITGGLLLVSNMMAFFAGEANGQKKAQE